MAERTALHQVHLDNAAKLVSFSGCKLPLHYGSVIREHLAVRESAGMFDVSQLCTLDIHGAQVNDWLRVMLTNDVAKLSDGQGLYSCLCREDGGVIDDLIVFRISEHHYRFSLDSARYVKVRAWLDAHLASGLEITQEKGLAVIAVQGPDAVTSASAAIKAMGLSLNLLDLPRFGTVASGNWFVSRTGYSGEDGVEIALPGNQATQLWHALDEQFVTPAGLGARDTLRLEAGFGAYGQDIDEEHSAVEAGLAGTVDIRDEDRAFIGREVLEDHKQFGGRYFLIGLMLDGHGMFRRGANVELVGESIGHITSGSYSPTRGVSIGLARVSRMFTGSCDVAVRDRLQPAHITSVPFVPHGLARE